MKIQVRRVSLALGLAGYAAAAAALEPSAVLRQPQGRVFVGQATTMGLARDGLPLYAGNRVVATAGGRAEVVYPNGCAVAVPENSLLTVGEPEQCRQARARVRTIDGFQDTRIGQAGPLPAAGSGGIPVRASAAGSGKEWGARLEQPKGSMFVEESGALAPGRQHMRVQSDNRLITEADSEVTVVFDGCEIEVGPGERVTVEELRARCKEGVLDDSQTGKDLVAGLKQPRGDVFVGEGEGRTLVRARRAVFGNDLIVTEGDGKVIVVFEGCRTRLGENERVLVEELSSQCVAGLWVGTGGTVVAVLGGVLVGAAIIHDNNTDAGPTSPP